MAKAAVETTDPVVVARQNTAIEGLAEAIENMCLALNVKLAKGGDAGLAKQVYDTARADLCTALRGFVAPHLRLIEGGGHQGYEPSTPKEDRIECAACHRDKVCADKNCPDWHKALRAAIKPAAVEEEPDNVA
jgi:hypothetical protein